MLLTVNPATEQVLNEYEGATKNELEKKVNKSRQSFVEWQTNIDKRAAFLYNFAHYFRKDKERLARLVTLEMGKPIKESRSEVDKCAWAMEYYADYGRNFISDETTNTDARKSFTTFQPLGVVGSIMPWNFPYWQALRFAGPSLMAGNTVILKPASATLQCGLEIANAFEKSGLPEGVFQTLIGNSAIAEMLIDSEVDAVTFTGSVEVGKKVGQRAVAQLKKCVLELGGSDPFIICEDADIEKASTGAVKGRFINCGQSCIATKRFLVVERVAKEFIDKFVQKTQNLTVGDPLSETTDVGPLVNFSSLENIAELVKDALNKGAEALLGGERRSGKGYFYNPTILTNINQKMRIAHEETFGPVAPITIVKDEKEAVKLANDSEFGLGASIWTQDLHKAEKLSRLMEAGIVTVNNVVVSDPRVPFGGIKNSGFGRELARYGMLEFVNIKSVRFYDQLIYNHYVE
jgi:succinate-semialdehyde dehydrogenase/glutarate-semialdehyde dehydrogenase/succinyl-CoA reductase